MTVVLPYDEAKLYMREQLESYLQESRGINIRRRFHCINPNHADADPSMSFWKGHNAVHCFACNKTYDIFDVIGIDFNLSNPKDKWKKACEIFDVELEGKTIKNENRVRAAIPHNIETIKTSAQPTHKKRFTDYYESLQPASLTSDYMSKRGISNEISDKFKILFDPNFKTRDNTKDSKDLLTWQAIVIPKTSYSYVARNTDSNCKKFNRIRNHGYSALYNWQILKRKVDKPIIIVEGEFDVISVYEVGGEAIGLGGTSGINKLISLVKSCPSEVTLLVALDNDKAGESAAMDLLIKLKALNVPCNKVNLYETYKDANEILVKDRVKFKNNVYAEMHKEVPKNPKFVFRLS